ncbi:MAG: alpha/beta fold hydrolase [Devosia nanyangense]|uniref:Alpha/beta fold hydrolase n=1 Tax=Devosia nanyangense TaxID=1228055 RepID=A0A933L0M6_9HYPH|nr:alpha/beta fold hydrolase [Devosia nanyangense]
MTGSKAMAIDAFGESHGLAVTRFDYSGHGQSGGEFNAGTISRWLEETLAVFDTTAGPQIVIGSSMGGWIALLLARALRRRSSSRIAGMVLIAPATDMTEELMLKQFKAKDLKLLERQGFVEQPSDYADTPYRLNQALLEDGKAHLLLGRAIETGCPVTILQGARDRDVPKEHAMRLVQHLLTDPVTLTLIPDGEHRLSRPEDLALLKGALEHMIVDLATHPAD